MNKSKKRDTFTYQLKDDNKIVYIGETNDIDATEQRHIDDSKKFSKIVKTSAKMKKETAEKREEENLRKYRNNHNGKNPKYNKTKNG